MTRAEQSNSRHQPDREDVEALNDHLAAAYSINDYYEKSALPIRLIEQVRLKIIKDMVGERPGMRIAEVGSGGGHVLRMFRRSKLLAVDVSSVYLETARKNLKGYDVSFLKGEVDRMDPLPAGFDRVICTEVLEHTLEPGRVLDAIARMLAPGGRAIITVPNDPLILRLKAVARHSPLGWWWGDRIEWGGEEMHLHRWTPSQFRRVLGCRFRVIEQRGAPIDTVPVRACFLCEPR